MVNIKEQQLSAIFSALSDPTRRAMLARLGREDMSVKDLAEPFSISKSAVTKHVKVLEKSGLLNRTVEGRVHKCRLQAETLQQVSEWVEFYSKFWNTKLDSLENYLNKD